MQTDLKRLERAGTDPVSARFQHTNLEVPTPLALTTEFEYPPHAAVGSFWLTLYPDQILLFLL